MSLRLKDRSLVRLRIAHPATIPHRRSCFEQLLRLLHCPMKSLTGYVIITTTCKVKAIELAANVEQLEKTRGETIDKMQTFANTAPTLITQARFDHAEDEIKRRFAYLPGEYFDGPRQSQSNDVCQDMLRRWHAIVDASSRRVSRAQLEQVRQEFLTIGQAQNEINFTTATKDQLSGVS